MSFADFGQADHNLYMPSGNGWESNSLGNRSAQYAHLSIRVARACELHASLHETHILALL